MQTFQVSECENIQENHVTRRKSFTLDYSPPTFYACQILLLLPLTGSDLICFSLALSELRSAKKCVILRDSEAHPPLPSYCSGSA